MALLSIRILEEDAEYWRNYQELIQTNKTIINNRYVFSVAVSLPLLGPIMSYSGRLTTD